MAYKALYRSYRPGKFLEVVGQKPIIKTLQNAIKENKTSHAYVFSGSRGIGKTTIARIFAKAVNCEQPENGEPCNICKNCLAVMNDSTTDIIELDAASNNGVDDMRDILEKVNFLPSFLKKKVYIIDEAHMLTQSSFNALLKTLEEPPSYIVFIFATTEPNKLPATILSRCQRFNFKPLTQKEIKDNLKYICHEENILITDEALDCISEAAEGGMRDALSILDQVSVYSEDEITVEDVENVIGKVSAYKSIEIIESLKNKDASTSLGLLNDLIDNGKEISRITSNLTQFCRDMLLYKTTENKDFYKHVFEIKEFQELADEISERELFYYIDVLVNVQNKIRFSNTPKIFLEIGIMKIISNVETDLDFDERISKLEKRQPSGMYPQYNNTTNDPTIENRFALLENKVKKLYAEIDKMNIPGLKETINSKFEILEDSASFVATLPKDLPVRIENLEQSVKELDDRIEVYRSSNNNSLSNNETNDQKQETNINEELVKVNERLEKLENREVVYSENNVNVIDDNRLKELSEFDELIANSLDELRKDFSELSEKVQSIQNTLNNVNREELSKRRNPFEQPRENTDEIVFDDEMFGSTELSDIPTEDIYSYVEDIEKQITEKIELIDKKFADYATIVLLNETKEDVLNSVNNNQLEEKLESLKEFIENVKEYSFKLNIKVTAIEQEIATLKEQKATVKSVVETETKVEKQEVVETKHEKEEKTESPEEVVESGEKTVESVYDVKIVERILHQARDPKCRAEKDILISKWDKLSVNASPMLANTANLLSSAKLVANGFNELLIVYPNATLCNHMMEEKTHLQAKQILRIVYGKEYDFLALPENVWQYKRNEYRGQYSMGIRYPKLTPINDPGLKVLKSQNATLGNNKPQPVQQAKDIFGDNLVDTEGEN